MLPPSLKQDDVDKITAFHGALYTFNENTLRRFRMNYDVFVKPYLMRCRAAAINHYPALYDKYGPANRMVYKMDATMIKLGIVESRKDAMLVLSEWSSAIQADHRDRNQSSMARHPRGAVNTEARLNQHSSLLQKIIESDRNKGMLLRQSLARQDELMDLVRKLGRQSTESPSRRQSTESPSRKSSSRKRTAEEAAANPPEVPTFRAPPAAGDEQLESAVVQPAAKRLLNAFDRLTGAASAPKPGGKGSGPDTSKGFTVEEAITELYKSGKISGRKGNIAMAGCPWLLNTASRSKYTHCIDLVMLSWTEEQKQLLMTENLGEAQLKTVAKQVLQEATLSKLTSLLGRNDKGRMKGTVMSLGQEYQKVRDKVASVPVLEESGGDTGNGIIGRVLNLLSSPSKAK